MLADDHCWKAQKAKHSDKPFVAVASAFPFSAEVANPRAAADDAEDDKEEEEGRLPFAPGPGPACMIEAKK